MSAVPADIDARPPGRWADAALAAVLCAVDPVGTGGAVLRALPGPARDRWLERFGELLPHRTPVARVPLHIDDARLLGGLDLAATLRAGRPVAQQGLLAESDGGVLLLSMAERVSAGMAARLAAALDTQGVSMERDGLAARRPARLGVIALDEGLADDEAAPAALRERLAFHLDLEGISRADLLEEDAWERDDVCAARTRIAHVTAGDDVVEALCAAALALGVPSVRAPLLALRAARAAAALDGRTQMSEADVVLAARLVLAPRATRLPAMAAEEREEPPPYQPPDQPPDEAGDENPDATPEADPPSDEAPPPSAEEASPPAVDSPLDDVVLAAAQAAIPARLLAALAAGQGVAARGAAGGRAGAWQNSRLRGRPIGARRGEPRSGARLSLVDTLRAAAPWQGVRRREAPSAAARVLVQREDFHVTRYRQRSETTTVFVVDASGSAALHRLAETKGAVELLLADCYVRRDRVAVIAFRGASAELLLPPTRSLVRAKRSLAGLPGGGGTPLAAGIDAARVLGEAARRRGETPLLVLMTDGRANIARDGAPGRARAGEDALAAARALCACGLLSLLLDTSPQPAEQAQILARAMGGRYLPLPYADAAGVSRAVRSVAQDA